MKNTTTTLSPIYSVPCGAGFLCSNTADFADPWIAASPEADEPNDSLATEEEFEEALSLARLDASGSKIEYFKMDSEDGGLELADGGIWGPATRLAKITRKNGTEYYAAEDGGRAEEIDDDLAEMLLGSMITDENPPAGLISKASFFAI